MANLIVTTMRDEDNLVLDFIVHHLALGFERIIIFDDASAVPVGQHLLKLPPALRDKVECHRLGDNFYKTQDTIPVALFDAALLAAFPNNKQMYLCNFALTHFCRPTDWVALIDVDEFICLPAKQDIAMLRAAIERGGFAAISLTMLVYGHSFNLVAPKDNNLCAFIWRSESFTFHGKFFAHVGALTSIRSPHFPTLHSPELFCDGNFKPCENATCFNTAKHLNLEMPHLKHYMILDVYSCFKRRMRKPLDRGPYKADEGAWLTRVEMLRWSSAVPDSDLAASILLTRARAGMDISSHARALSNALDRVESLGGSSATLDFEWLRASLGASATASDATLLFELFSQELPNTQALRFAILPNDFDTSRYRALNPALAGLPERDLRQHYLNYGRLEGRAYR